MFTFSGCALLEAMIHEGNAMPQPVGSGDDIVTSALNTAVNIATGSGILPPWIAPIIYSVLGVGGGGLLLNRKKHKKERIKLASIIESLKEVAPEDVDKLLDELNVTDSKFYEKEIKDASKEV